MSRTMGISVMLLMSFFIAGCSKSPTPGKYVYRSPNEVDMFDLVEAPAGHLNGTLVISALNQYGIRKPDVVRSVAGSIYRGNVSLEIGNNGILSSRFNTVGTLNSDEMRLDFGGNTENFQKASLRKYAATLAQLNRNGDNIKLKYEAIKEAKDLNNYVDTLDAELQGFVSWGNDRIARVSNARNWYANRVTQYQKCLDFVRPLALRQVPSWKWQSCVLNLDNDRYNREQIGDAIAQLEIKELADEHDLSAKVAALPQQISKVHNTLDKVCLLFASEKDCKVKMDGLMEGMPPFSLSTHITEYNDMLPRVHSAINEDMRARAVGEKKLSALVNEADGFLRRSR